MNNIIERLFGAHVEENEPEDNEVIYEDPNADSDGYPLEPLEQVYPEKVPLPVVHTEPGGYEFVSRSRWYGQAIADSTGTATITVPSKNSAVVWMIERIGTFVGSSGAYGTLVVYEGSAANGRVLDVSRQSPDIADQAQPIWIQDVDMTIVATGMAVGDELRVAIQYRLLHRMIAAES